MIPFNSPTPIRFQTYTQFCFTVLPSSKYKVVSFECRSNPTNCLEYKKRKKRAVDLSKIEFLRKMGSGCFKESENSGKNKGLKFEFDSGGQDVFDENAMEASGGVPEHLVIMVNGIIGSAEDWKYAAAQFVKKLPDKVIVHRSECNYSKLTFDGVDLMGERLAQEVLSVIRHRPGVRKISFIAHSLGGLVARYAIGRLYEESSGKEDLNMASNHSINEQTNQSDEFAQRSSNHSINEQTNQSNEFAQRSSQPKIANLEPMNFITFATPHLGSRGHNQLPILCGLPFLESKAPQTAHLIVGRSGKHLFLTDNDDGKPPLLLQMVNDSGDLKFMSALRAFKRRVAYANVNYDHVVGWGTSSIRRQRELPKSNLLAADEMYPHIVYVEKDSFGATCNEQSSGISNQNTDLEEEMIKGLNQVPWERVDVSFQKSKYQRYVAHNTILVKSYWLNSDGADVVFHMIDNFLL